MITIRQIVQNIGKGQSSVAVKYILADLERNYHKIKTGIEIIHAEILADGTKIHLSIPSSDKPISYDVVLWVKSLDRLTLDTEFKAFSNSPHFSYNFVYIFNTEDSLLFPEKYPQTFLTMPPKTRNPYGLFGFDKGLFAAVKYIGFRNLKELTNQYESVAEKPILSFAEKQGELSKVK